MASYTTGKVGGATAAAGDNIATAVDRGLSERMATLAGGGCLMTTPVRYHSIRFVLVLGAPLLAFCERRLLLE